MCARAQSLMLDINGYDVKGSEGGGVWKSGGNGGGGGAVGHGGAVDDVGGAVDGVGGAFTTVFATVFTSGRCC